MELTLLLFLLIQNFLDLMHQVFKIKTPPLDDKHIFLNLIEVAIMFPTLSN